MAAVSSIAIAGLAIAAVGTGVSIYQQRRAAKAQKRAAEVQRRQRDAELARARRQQIAEARRRRAAVINAAAQTGTSGSSGEAGALGSVQSQLGGNLGFMAASGRRANQVEALGSDANRAQNLAAIGQGVASIGSSIFSTFGGAPESPKPKTKPTSTMSSVQASRF